MDDAEEGWISATELDYYLYLAPICHESMTQLLVTRSRKRLRNSHTRQSLTEDILIKIFPNIPNTRDGINIRVALCVGFAAFLRSGEFTWDSWDPNTSPKRQLARKHIQFNTDQSVTLTLPSSKTDPYAIGVDIHLARASTSPLCPVAALNLLFTRYPEPPHAPLFSRSFGAFSKPFFISQLREYLLNSGIPTNGFSGHSLRKGAAITAVMKGIPKDEIKLLGRWKSDAVDIYTNDLPQGIRSTKLLHLNSRFLNNTTLRFAPLGPSTSSSSSTPTPPRRSARRDLQRSSRSGATAVR
jgi:hypothetical protein